jgi:hypothetical protein
MECVSYTLEQVIMYDMYVKIDCTRKEVSNSECYSSTIHRIVSKLG